MTGERGRARRWPLLLLAAPAAVSVWSGWVGLGEMAGFGVVHPLPGIADDFTLNSAITLPIGVEAYGALAMGTWLSERRIPGHARRFAGWSALAALVLGLVGQVLYHLLATAGMNRAPVAVVVFVACLPVLVVGGGAALYHLLGDTPTATHEPAEAERPSKDTPSSGALPAVLTATDVGGHQPTPVAVGTPRGKRTGRKTRRPVPRRLFSDFLIEARELLAREPVGTDPTPSWCQRVTGCSDGTSVKLARALRAELATAERPTTTTEHITQKEVA